MKIKTFSRIVIEKNDKKINKTKPQKHFLFTYNVFFLNISEKSGFGDYVHYLYFHVYLWLSSVTRMYSHS